MRPSYVAAFAPLAVFGCATESWRNADFQVDVSGAGLGDEDKVRLCVAGVGMIEQAVGDGTVGFTGIPQGLEVALTIDLLDDTEELRLGRAGPLTVNDGHPYTKVDWQTCDLAADPCAPCQTPGESVEAGSSDALLAVRFLTGS